MNSAISTVEVLMDPMLWFNAAMYGSGAAIASSFAFNAAPLDQRIIMVGAATTVGAVIMEIFQPRITMLEKRFKLSVN